MIYKTRLVARGFEERNLNNIRKSSLTCCEDNFRLVLSIIVSNSWIIHSLEIKSAFLQGKKIDRDVYLKPTKEAETSKLWKLNITAYGLCDAPRAWYISVKDVLRKTGVKKSKFDGSIFYWYNNNKLEGLICCHVDDFFRGGTKYFAKSVINRLKEKFLTRSEKFENFKYTGLNLVQKDDCVYLDQRLYIDELKEVVFSKNRKMPKDSPLTTDKAL